MTTEKRRRDRVSSKQAVPVTKTVFVHKSNEDGLAGVSSEPIDVLSFEVEPAHVRAGASRCINLGNYETLRLEVSISMPCYVERIEQTYDTVSEMVADMLEQEELKWFPPKGEENGSQS